ncbi:MAG TPA: TIGR01841 family phasin [Casimicrobiaceae bacterium]|nr:TIGR01841 family phasin [Casimicrobiaceae bacterium]
MARKSASQPSRPRRRTTRRPRVAAAPKAAAKLAGVKLGDLSKMTKVLTPEQAFELFRANARMALDVVDAAIESTAKLRKLQFEGEQQARSMQQKAVRHAAEADDPRSLVAAGQAVTQEAVEKAMQYWTQMFDMIVEIQKRLFTLVEQQMGDVPGAREAKAAMAMMPDLRQAQNLVRAMQGIVSSGGSAFESMQRMVGDFTRLAQQTMPGIRR